LFLEINVQLKRVERNEEKMNDFDFLVDPSEETRYLCSYPFATQELGQPVNYEETPNSIMLPDMLDQFNAIVPNNEQEYMSLPNLTRATDSVNNNIVSSSTTVEYSNPTINPVNFPPTFIRTPPPPTCNVPPVRYINPSSSQQFSNSSVQPVVHESFLKQGFEILALKQTLEQPLSEYHSQWELAAKKLQQHKVEISQLKRMQQSDIMDCLKESGIEEYGVRRRIMEAIIAMNDNTRQVCSFNIHHDVQTTTPVTPVSQTLFDQILLKDRKNLTKHGDRKKNSITKSVLCKAS